MAFGFPPSASLSSCAAMNSPSPALSILASPPTAVSVDPEIE